MKPKEMQNQSKKSHCLRNCLIAYLLITVLFIGALCGGAYFAYEQFARPIVKISLPDVIGVLHGVGHYDKDLEKTQFTDADATAFYDNFEEATCLKLPPDFKISTAVNEAMKSIPKDDPNNPNGGDPNQPPMPPAPPVARVDMPGLALAPEGEVKPDGGGSVAPEGGTTPEGGGEPAPEDPFGAIKDFKTGNEYLDNVLRETEFDFSSLQDFNGEGRDLVVTDKQFAAIINEVIVNLDIPEVKQIEEQFGVELAKLVSLKSVTISGVPSVEAALAEEPLPGIDMSTIDEAKKPIKISLVLCINIKDNINSILTKVTQGQVPELFINMAGGLLPDKMFIGAGVYPYNPEAKPEIFFNGVRGKVMDNLITAISGVLEYTNSEMTIDSIFGKVSEMVTQTILTMENMVGELRFVDSSLAIDPISMIMSVLKVNVPDPETGSVDHYINGSNFFMMLKHLYHTDNTIGSLDIDAYLDGKVGAEHRISEASYVDDLASLASAYGIKKETDFDLTTWTPKDFMEKASTIPEHINVVDSSVKTASGDKKIYEATQTELEELTGMSDNALGYMVDSLLKENFKDGIAGIPFELGVESLVLYEPSTAPGELRLRMTAGVATRKMKQELLEANAVLSKLITSVIPEHLYMEVEIPMSKNAGGAALIINFLGRNGASGNITDAEMQEGIKETKEAFTTLVRIISAFDKETGAKLDIDTLLKTLEDKVEEMLIQLENQIQSFISSVDGGTAPVSMAGEEASQTPTIDRLLKPGRLQLPTVFEIIQILAGDDVTVDDVQGALKGLYTYNEQNIPTVDESNEIIDGFITRELEGKLFLKNDPDPITNVKPINSSNIFTEIQNLGTKVTEQGVGEIIDARALIESPKTLEELKLSVQMQDLAAVINTNDKLIEITASLPYDKVAVASGSSITKDAKGDYVMNITMGIDSVKPGAIEGVGLKYENLLPGKVFIKASVKLTDVTGAGDKYATSIYINNIDDASKNTIDKILTKFMKPQEGQMEMSFAAIESQIGIQISEALKSFESSVNELTFSEANGGSILAMSIYDVIYDQVVKDMIVDEADRVVIAGADGKQGPLTVKNLFQNLLKEVSVLHTEGEKDLTSLASELNNKLLLADGTLDGKDLFGSISKITEGDIFAKLDTAKLWSVAEFKDIANMDITINETQLITIMREKVTGAIKDLPKLFSKMDIENITLDNDILSADISISVDHTTTDPSFKQIVPFMPTKLVVGLSLDYTTGSCITTLKFNGLGNDDMNKANILLKAMTQGDTGAAFDMDTIMGDINKQIDDIFKLLTDIGLKLVFKTDMVESGNLFDVIIKASPDMATLKAEELHHVLYYGLDPNTEENVVAGATDLSALSGRLNNQMLLADGVLDANDLFGSISDITDTSKGGNVFDKIAVNKLWDNNYDTPDKMNIEIKQDEMIKIMRDKMTTIPMDNLPPIFNAPVVNNAVIGNDTLQMELKITIDKTSTDPNYKDILAFMPDKIVLGATVNVVTGDTNIIMNNLKTAEDMQLATKVLKTFKFDITSITSEMGSQITNITNMTKDVGLDLKFNAGAPDGQITSGNIFDVIVKSDAKFSTITAEELHLVMYKGLDPNAVENIGTGENLDTLSTELNDKMLLADGTIKADNMIGSMSGLNSGDIFSKVQLGKLWLMDDTNTNYRFETEDKLNINITGGQMITMMQDKIKDITFSGLPTIFKAPAINNVTIGKDSMAIEFKIEVDKTSTDPAYKDILALMPNKMILKSTMYFDGTSTDTLLINSLKPEDNETATKVFKTMNFDITSVSTELSTQMNSIMNSMSDVGLALTFNEDGTVSTGNIYDVIRKADAKGQFTNVTDAELHSMLRNLYAPKDIQDKLIINRWKAEAEGVPTDYAGNPCNKITPDLSGGLALPISDWYISHKIFSGSINKLVNGDPNSGEKIGDVTQMTIFSGAGFAKVNETFPGFLPASSTRGIMMSVDVATASYNTDAASGGLSSVVPERLMITVLLDIPVGITDASQIEVIPVVNNMSTQDMTTLNKVLGDNQMINSITKSLNDTVLGVEFKIEGQPKAFTLGTILTSPNTTYENAYTGVDTGTFGSLVHKISGI